MSMVTVTKRFQFCYGHFLPDYNGKCRNPHGHNAELEVEVERLWEDHDYYPTMVIDFNDLKPIVNEVLNRIDHTNLNDSLPRLDPPTVENMVVWIGQQINDRLPAGCRVVSVRCSETPDSWATWRNDG